ncbi:hypothetical protein QFC24_006951 [Naganishia onofrii]|uniref:Uncharacterized protein n=1 Tax=Naganishia onofrii TaxID=1851511 RepID=A0ACC2WXL3_9TREE|nr:hypothetical protein QFC24_006951 [Naganishia onofrii]
MDTAQGVVRGPGKKRGPKTVHVQLADSQPPEGPVNPTPSRLQHAPENQDVSSLNTPGNHAQDADKYNDVSPVPLSHPQPHTGISTESGTQHDLKDTRRREAAEEEERQGKAVEAEPRRREVEENEEGKKEDERHRDKPRRRHQDASSIPDKPKHVAYADSQPNYEIHEPKPIPFKSRLPEIPDDSAILSFSSGLPYLAGKSVENEPQSSRTGTTHSAIPVTINQDALTDNGFGTSTPENDPFLSRERDPYLRQVVTSYGVTDSTFVSYKMQQHEPERTLPALHRRAKTKDLAPPPAKILQQKDIDRSQNAGTQSKVQTKDLKGSRRKVENTIGVEEPKTGQSRSKGRERQQTSIGGPHNRPPLESPGGTRSGVPIGRSPTPIKERTKSKRHARSPSKDYIHPSSSDTGNIDSTNASGRAPQIEAREMNVNPSAELERASSKPNARRTPKDPKRADSARTAKNKSASSKISTSSRIFQDGKENDGLYTSSSDSYPQPSRSHASGNDDLHNVASKNRETSQSSPEPASNGRPGTSHERSERSDSVKDQHLPKEPVVEFKPKLESKTRNGRNANLPDSDSDNYSGSDDRAAFGSSASLAAKGKSSPPPATNIDPRVGFKDTPDSASSSPPPSKPNLTASPAKAGLKSWMRNLSSQRLGMGIFVALVGVCILSMGSSGSGGSGLTSLAGGGIFLVVLAALGLWAWYKNGKTSRKEQDASATEEKDAVGGNAELADGNNKGKDEDGDDNSSDSDDDHDKANGDRKSKDGRNTSNGKMDDHAADHDHNRDLLKKCQLLHKQAEDRALKLFPDVPRNLVLDALDDYTRAPWTEAEPRSIKELKKADKDVWKKKNPHAEKSYSRHFGPLQDELRKEAKKLFAGLLRCNGAYLSGDQFRVELMFEAPIAIRVTAFPGERLTVKPSVEKEQERWYKGLDTLISMKKCWDDLRVPDLPNMPPIETICIRPPADFTLNKFERICGLRVGTRAYHQELKEFVQACSVERHIGEFATGHRRAWILDLFLKTRPSCIQIDFLPHRRYQAVDLDWNVLSSTSTSRHIDRFGDVIRAVEDYTRKNSLEMLDVGPCLPLNKSGIQSTESLLKKVAGQFSFAQVKVRILRLGLEDPSIMGPGKFSEANDVAKTLCNPEVDALDLFQPRPDTAAKSFLLDTVNEEQAKTFKKHVASEFERRIVDNVDMAQKLLHFMRLAHHSVRNQRPCPHTWTEQEYKRLEERLAVRLSERSAK